MEVRKKKGSYVLNIVSGNKQIGILKNFVVLSVLSIIKDCVETVSTFSGLARTFV